MPISQREEIPEWIKQEGQRLFGAQRNGNANSPFVHLQESAFREFQKHGMPSTKLESWKYTSLQAVMKHSFNVVRSDDSPLPVLGDLAPYLLPVPSALRFVFVDGRFVDSLSSISLLPKGVEFFRFAAHSESVEDVDYWRSFLEGRSRASENPAEDAFPLLNTAFAQDGLGLRFTEECADTAVVQVLYVSSSKGRERVCYPRVITSLSPRAKAVLVETFVGLHDAPSCTNALTQHHIEEHANMQHIRIIAEGPAACHISRVESEQAAQSTFSAFCLSLGGRVVRHEVHPRLLGQEAEANLFGLSALKQEQHVDNSTIIDHAHPNCQSNELYKGIYADSSRGVFSGTIIVRQDAQKTNAFQSNQSLLLSDKAAVDSRPQLKIWADDVRCSHGATVGQLDDEALFYLRSRGLDKDTALALLMQAFAGEVVHKISGDELRSHVEEMLNQRLSELALAPSNT